MAKPNTKKTSVKIKGKKMGSLAKRILAALVMLPMAIGALWGGYPFVDVLVLIVGVLLAWEWTNMISSPKSTTYLAAYITSLAVSLFVLYIPMKITMIVLVSFFVWFNAKNEQHRKLLVLGVPYISIGIGSLLWMYNLFGDTSYSNVEGSDFYKTLWFCIMVWAMDIGGFIVGSNLKGPKLAPKISPNKTWSGLFGGIIFAMSASYLYYWSLAEFDLIRIDVETQKFYAGLGGIIAAVSQIGDFIESAIKRKLGLKDSSAIIPGHGGVFDRIDGLIFAAPFVYLFFVYLKY